MLNKIHRYPFLRLVVPLIAGIYFGDYLFNQDLLNLSSLSFSAFLISFLLLIFLHLYVESYKFRWIFGFFTFLSLFFLGSSTIAYRLEQTQYDFSFHNSTYQVVLSERPQIKNRSMLCKVDVISSIDSISRKPINKRALLYLSKDSTSQNLSSGDQLLVNTRFTKAQSRNNPEEFDYNLFLNRKGISATAFADSMRWQIISHAGNHDAREKANRLRDIVLSKYQQLGFNGENLAVLSALTLGYKDDLEDETRQAYSIAGASHILAISGMHIGFLCMMLMFLFRWIPERWRSTRFIKVVIIISILWAFAFLIGLTPSAVRSVSMFSLLMIGTIFYRKQDSLNILFATAFIMLLIYPSWLFEIGFQLSFLAVLSILLCQPIYQKFTPNTNRIGRFIVSILYVSIAAQIGVAPLIIFYFSSFPTHFLLTNLLVIPLVSLIIYASVVMLIFSFIPSLQFIMASLVRVLVDTLNTSIHWIEDLPYSSFNNLSLHQLEVLLLYLFILLTVFFLYRNKANRLLLSLFCLFLFFTTHLVFAYNNRPEPSIIFYNIRNFPVVHCINNDRASWIATADTLLKKDNYPKSLKPYWQKMRLEEPILINSDVKEDNFLMYNQIIQFHQKRICIVSDDRWHRYSTHIPLTIDYLYICKGYKGKLENLLNLFYAKQVIIDSSISNYWKATYEADCKRLGVRFHSLSDKGSARFLL